jgi:hypothetical protein
MREYLYWSRRIVKIEKNQTIEDTTWGVGLGDLGSGEGVFSPRYQTVLILEDQKSKTVYRKLSATA